MAASFPEKYQAAIIRSAEPCAVKKHLEPLPETEVKTVTAEPVPV